MKYRFLFFFFFRDFEYMTGLSIIQACLALCFYKTLPENLINQIFNIEFIRRLEDEIQMCYSKVFFFVFLHYEKFI